MISLQNVIRKVYDPDTGRHRLVKGSGEILEEIVSYNRHKDINRDPILQSFRYFMAFNPLCIYCFQFSFDTLETAYQVTGYKVKSLIKCR